MEALIKEKKFLKGVFTFRNYAIECQEAQEIDALLRDASHIEPNEYKKLLARLEEICTVRTFSVQNQVVLSGRSVFARLLVGDTTYSGEINYGALGTGSAAVSDSDTVLDTEVKRKGTATQIRTNDSVTVDFYYSKSDTNGTYEEFGTFIDGTSTVDTGQLYNRVLTGGWTKSALEAMTVSLQIDINNP